MIGATLSHLMMRLLSMISIFNPAGEGGMEVGEATSAAGLTNLRLGLNLELVPTKMLK